MYLVQVSAFDKDSPPNEITKHPSGKFKVFSQDKTGKNCLCDLVDGDFIETEFESEEEAFAAWETYCKETRTMYKLKKR